MKTSTKMNARPAGAFHDWPLRTEFFVVGKVTKKHWGEIWANSKEEAQEETRKLIREQGGTPEAARLLNCRKHRARYVHGTAVTYDGTNQNDI